MTTKSGTEEKVPEVESQETTEEYKPLTQEEHQQLIEERDHFKSAYGDVQSKQIAPKDQRIQELEGKVGSTVPRDEFESLQLSVATLTDAVKDSFNKEDEEATPTKGSKQSEVAQLEARLTAKKNEELQSNLETLRSIGQEVNLDAYTSTEFKWARDLFSAGKPAEGLQKAREIVGKLKESQPPKAEEKETEEQMKERIKREILDEQGKTKQEPGGPSGGGHRIPTDMGEFREWIKDIPQEEFETDYAAQVNKMMKQGEIK